MSTPDHIFMQSSADLHRSVTHGQWQGLANLWHREQGRWWRGSRWLFIAITWLLVVDGIFAATAFSPISPSDFPGITGITQPLIDLYLWALFAAIFTCTGTIIGAHNQIIGERQSGTAAWIMSKPVTARAFLLAKCAVMPGMLLTQVGIPFAVALGIIQLAVGTQPPLLATLFALSFIAGLNVLFYCLTLWLGTLFLTRVPILSISFVALFVMLQAGSNPMLTFIVAVGTDQALVGAVSFVVSLLLAAGLMLGGAIWRFGREEF